MVNDLNLPWIIEEVWFRFFADSVTCWQFFFALFGSLEIGDVVVELFSD
jgi:hypothetical protein